MGTPFQPLCVEYLTALREARQHALATDELSLRPALDALLKQASAHFERPVAFLSEAKKISSGRPDFTATVNGLPIGYVEAEAFGVNLDKLTGRAKAQNDRFRANLDNFLLTNHLEFRLYLGGEMTARAALPEPPEQGKIRVDAAETDALAALLTRFLRGEWAPIASPKDLAFHLARRTRQIRNEVVSVLRDPAAKQSELCEQFEAVKVALLPDVTDEQFAGLYAQTIVYGLFAARCMASSGLFNRLSAATLVPKTNPFLRKLFQRIAALDLDDRVAWIADDAAQLLGKARMADILADFGARAGKEDPVVHFYETFLAEYDPAVRDARGVYYTPEPVVNYIVRSIDALLKTKLNRPFGLADERALILDPATGTGSFLFAAVKLIHAAVCQKAAGAWAGYVEQKLLPRLFGFELLMAPYAVAHLKLALQLQQTGYQFSGQQRLGVYLTNSLDEAVRKSDLLFGSFISEESNAAVLIKKEYPILVVLGNPPYSGVSANRSVWIRQQLQAYRTVNGQPLQERKTMLDDDYVKFIRFAQWRIQLTGEGLIGYITNHAYLDNPTFRGMRQNLLETFDSIYIYNLHGNIRRQSREREAERDENVFDIQQGVAMLFCVKTPQSGSKSAEVHYAELRGSRKEKYAALNDADLTTTAWMSITPTAPFYLFIPQAQSHHAEWEAAQKVSEAFVVYTTGITTSRDEFVIDFDAPRLLRRVEQFAASELPPEEVAARFHLQENYAWRIREAQRALRQTDSLQACLQPVAYRPFDQRWLCYHPAVVWRVRQNVMRHLQRPNLALLCMRRTRQGLRGAFFVVNTLCDRVLLSSVDNAHVFLLYLHDETGARRPNFSPAFLKAMADKLRLKQQGEFGLPEGMSPEDIFHYAYAVFHSPTYRERYAEFLKIDFPRLPLTGDLELFRDLAELGRQLVARHLLDAQAAPVLQNAISPFPIAPADAKNGNLVETVTYDDETWRVCINKTQYFEDVPPEVWNFHVGGYQVCEKWLKDRKGRALTFDDIQQYQKIVVALAETLRLMTAIDERIQGFPLP